MKHVSSLLRYLLSSMFLLILYLKNLPIKTSSFLQFQQGGQRLAANFENICSISIATNSSYNSLILSFSFIILFGWLTANSSAGGLSFNFLCREASGPHFCIRYLNCNRASLFDVILVSVYSTQFTSSNLWLSLEHPVQCLRATDPLKLCFLDEKHCTLYTK